MKIILCGAILLAAACGNAQAGEGSGDIFAQHVPGYLGTYSTASAAPSLPRQPVAAPVPSYARLLPDNGSMSLLQIPNSLPTDPVVTGRAASGLSTLRRLRVKSAEAHFAGPHG